MLIVFLAFVLGVGLGAAAVVSYDRVLRLAVTTPEDLDFDEAGAPRITTVGELSCARHGNSYYYLPDDDGVRLGPPTPRRDSSPDP